MSPVLIAILFFIFGGLIISTIATAVEIKKHRPVEAATDVEQYIVPEKVEMSAVEDTFLRQNIQRQRIVQQQGGGSGRRSGGTGR